ncbi:flagellar biosynthesis protein FlaG [Campylobacter sp. MIT 99-7217]|uniref:flagellar protein FlaG n=1 Tax=Campylobacter sp. MIT 99-7217 TaxID=535091 RepID=UPI00115BD6EF|nr:flagellar protein FlaG [Campylobacter sp. MIT 99-7217]TQR31845.1 flagellar biosynthesis protein FlaG [Campylobacter sp. MIT 99-7217]
MEMKINALNINSSIPTQNTSVDSSGVKPTQESSLSEGNKDSSRVSGIGNAQEDLSSSEQLEELSQKLNEQMKSLQANISFSFSSELNGLYIKVTDNETGDVIRQIPSEEAIRLQEYFKNAVGLLFNQES